MSTENNDEYLVQSIFLLLITSICLGVSWYSMATGFESFFGKFTISAAVATVFVLMLAALNYTLRRGLINGISSGKITAILVLYLAVVILSFSGMFNKFYSQFVGNDLVLEEIDTKIDLLKDIKDRGMPALTDVESAAIRSKVNDLKGKLRREIMLQNEPGVGPEAKKILAEIKTLLGKRSEYRIYPTPSRKQKELEDVIKLFHQDIDGDVASSDILKRLGAEEKFTLSQRLPQEIDTYVTALTEARGTVGSKSSVAERDKALEVVQRAVVMYKKAGSEIAALVKDRTFEYKKNLRVENDRIGEIPHTFESARAHMERGSVWFAGLLALGIDLIVPVFVFFLTPRSGVIRRRVGERKGPGGLRTEY